MSKFVVSANYRDRQSQYKWLVRRFDEPIEKAVPCGSVSCSGVTFTNSNKAEEGFGCRTVAVCENVSVEYAENEHDLPTTPIKNDNWYSNRLAFDGSDICRTVPIKTATHINLCCSGNMYAFGETTDSK